jgi:VanZ family protein
MSPPFLTSGLLKLSFWFAAVLIGVLSLMPVDFLPPQAFDVWDKAQHAGAFAALALLGLSAYPRSCWQVGLGLLAYGAAIELAQSATGWRFGDWLDLLADLIGIILGSLTVLAIRRVRAAQHRQ